MSSTQLTKAEKLLLYGLKLSKMKKEDAVAIVFMTEEEEQILLIHYMATHKNSTPQEIMNECGRLLKQRKSMPKY